MRPFSFLTLISLINFSTFSWAQSSTTDACATVFSSTDYYIKAADAYACLTSTPFNATLATDLVLYWSETLQFHSTLAYLKNPPPGYQQSPVDLLAGFDLIQDQIDNGVYTNQYSFEMAVHSLLQKAHDFHLALVGGVTRVFAFTPGLALASVSLDGTSLPQLYDAAELAKYYEGQLKTVPSPIIKINGQRAESFASSYASRNSYGAIEQHGDWNQIMWSYAAFIQGYSDPFSSIYAPTSDALVLEYANGTTSSLMWNAVYTGPVGVPPINSGQDFYNYFVLGIGAPADASDPSSPESTSSYANPTEPTPVNIVSEAATTTYLAAATTTQSLFPGWGGAYPENPDVMQVNLGALGSYITGYFLRDTKIGVLSIPSFEIDPTIVGDSIPGIENFIDAIRQFLKKSKDAGMTKILIDLQQNYGGEQMLAREAFRQFFPNVTAFSGMRTRSFGMANELGNTMTEYFAQNYDSLNDTVYLEFLNDPWAVNNELNAGTGQYFESWQEYYGPHPDNNDQFSTVFQYNFSNPLYTLVAGGINETVESAPELPPYDARDITILTDSVCASTCDLFVEMMHHEAGVRTVVVGGMPQDGPMQARGAARGALALNSYNIDVNLAYAAAVNSSVSHLLVNRLDPTVAKLYSLQFNFADQIRAAEYVPLQFVYEAADCRIFWTPETYFNYTRLWQYAASAIFFDASTCVAHSAEHNNTMHTDTYGPSPEQLAAWAATNPANTPLDQSVMLNLAADQIAFWIGFNKDTSWQNGYYASCYEAQGSVCVGAHRYRVVPHRDDDRIADWYIEDSPTHVEHVPPPACASDNTCQFVGYAVAPLLLSGNSEAQQKEAVSTSGPRQYPMGSDTRATQSSAAGLIPQKGSFQRPQRIGTSTGSRTVTHRRARRVEV